MWGLISVAAVGLGIVNDKIIAYFSERTETHKVWIVLTTVGLVSGVAVMPAAMSERVWTAMIWNILFLIAVIDGYTHFIIDAMVYVLGVIVLVGHVFFGAPFMSVFYGGIFGFVFYALIYYGAKLYYKKEAFGFGDVMLMGVSGLYLGWPLTILTAFAAFYLALFGVIIQFVRHRKDALKQVIAFGPYICLATILSSIWGQKILDWYLSGLLF